MNSNGTTCLEFFVQFTAESVYHGEVERTKICIKAELKKQIHE